MTHTPDLPSLPELPATNYRLGVEGNGYGSDDRLLFESGYSDEDMRSYGRACYELGARSTAAQPAAWDGAEEWEQLAWQLCAEENGEDACTELVWEGGAIPEPWGDRWMKYEGEAKRMISLVRQFAPPAASGDSTPPSAPVQGDPSGALRPEPEAAGQGSVEGDVRALRQMFADCEVYLKEGETPAQRIERERRDTEAVLNLLIREKQRTEAMREVMLRMMAGIDHLAEIARQWEPDHSSGADRRGWVLAKDARDDAARLLQPEPQAASGERGD